MDNLTKVFTDSLHTGFIDKTILSDVAYQPELLVNQQRPPKKVLTTILTELEYCSEFLISVAFVTTGGVATIINTLKILEDKGVKGKILVSQYLNFTQPEALKRLLQFKNVELRVTTTGNAHAKGYIFKNKGHYNLIVGSSNLTDSALSSNKEWNMKVSALDNSELVHKVLKEFISDFEKATIVTPEYLLSYQAIYNKQFILTENFKSNIHSEKDDNYVPNVMQSEALRNLRILREKGNTKALIISATGTGKTFLSAFDAKKFNPKKLLFVVHRQNIAISAMKTFQHVFGSSKSMGLYSGNSRDLHADFIFSTVQTISRLQHLETFGQTEFDYLIIDETHRSAANSYLKILEYFKPKFLLGMTATPERSDSTDIFKLFDYNIAYEIRLSRAMEEEMLSTFHYYGVSEIFVNNQTIDNKSNFNLLISSERVERVIEQSNFYGTDNGITRGLIFCSRTDEAKVLSNLFNQKGLKTLALTGDSSDLERSKAIELLESDNISEKLDYILTVDIFNEGIDIPKVNQIIMLRPTESAIIFIQQLGRGLRKIEGKGYLTVIDFIGNYENNYLIPIALYGDTSYNKDTIRKLITEGSRVIPGASTINFDEITKEHIFQSIDAANMQLFADLKTDYNLLKYRLGRMPMMMDFVENASRDPFLFVEYSKSYYNFVCKVENECKFNFSEVEIKLLELFSKDINNSKRVEESTILLYLIEKGNLTVQSFRNYIEEKYGYIVSNETIDSCLINLNFEFIRENKDKRLLPVKEIYELDILQVKDGEFQFSEAFKLSLENLQFKSYLLDSTRYSIHQFNLQFEKNKWIDGFVLYRKYSRKDVFRILNAAENPVAQNVGGYLVSADNSNCPVFVNYHKEEHISASTKYEDEFINRNEFDWMSKSNRKIESKDVQSILGKYGPIRIPLFIKKNNDEGTDFYFMGEMQPILDQIEQTTINNNKGGKVSVVKIRFNVFPQVADNIFNYLNDNSSSKAKLIPIEKTNTNIIEDDAFHTQMIPFYNFYAAAGSFSELQFDNNYTLIEAPESLADSNNYFACKIIGESMNRVIPNGSICMFKVYNGGSRNGKIVLVENIELQDQDFNSAFTIKTYTSEKIVTEEGWSHTSIILRPNSYDKSYNDIIIDENNGQNMKVIGEFIKILK